MDLVRFEVSPALRGTLEPLILDALFEYCVRQRTMAGVMTDAPVQLTVAKALEVLEAHQPRWREQLQFAVRPLQLEVDGLPRKIGGQLHELLRIAHEFFRREGAHAFRGAGGKPKQHRRYELLWGELFSRRVLDWLRGNELMTDADNIESADVLVECVKLWVMDISRQMEGMAAKPAEPSSFFLDADTEISARFERGPIKLTVRGRPDSLLLRPLDVGMELNEYQLAEPDLAELRIAQAVLYMLIVERARGVACTRGVVTFFRAKPPAGDAGFPAAVEKAFDGFIGNAAAVRRMKLKVATARGEGVSRIADLCLLTGPAGVGKRELARRTAEALRVPRIEVPMGTVKTADELVSAIDKALEATGVKTDQSDKQLVKYPPFVLLMTDVHELRRRGEALLFWLLQPERRLTLGERAVSFAEVTVMAASDEPATLAEPFLTKFRRIEMESYRPEEVALMLRPVFEEKQLMLPDTLALLLAKMGRCNPGRAIDLTRGFRDRHALLPATTPLSRDALFTMARNDWQVDENGLTVNDYQYLLALESGPKGLPALQQLLPLSGDEMTTVIEPYLIQIGAVNRSSRGRALTVRGEQLLHRRGD